MVIQHNMPALNALRQTGVNNHGTTKNLEKLSSGFRINRSADDAAGLGISEKMRGQIRGLDMATRNASNGISLIQTAEGSLEEIHAILNRMRELSVQSSNGTYTDDVDRKALDKEIQALKNEIDRIASYCNYNGINLLDGSMGGEKAENLPGKAGSSGGLAPDGYEKGSIAALGSYLVNLGFPMMEWTGTSSCSILGSVALDSYNSSFDGQPASIILSNGRPALQVGDKAYTSVYHSSPVTYDVNGSPVTVDGAYAFVDENNNLVAALKVTDLGGTSLGEITGGRSAVIKNITMGTAPTNAYRIFSGGSNVGATYPQPGDPMYDITLSDENSKLVLQIGANGSVDQRIGLHVGNMSSVSLGTQVSTAYNPSGSLAGIKINPRAAANDAINIIDAAVNQVSGVRSDLGALQNRLEHTVNNLGVAGENLTAAESSIRDVDMAKEMMDFTKNNILVQASQSMLAQAAQLPQGVLQLLT